MNEFEFSQLNKNEEGLTPEVIDAIAEEERKPFEINLSETQRLELQNAIAFALER